MLGFAVVLAISAASMGFAYLGFERVSAGVDAYRRSVQEADLARDIDRELISYRSLARYFVATGKEEDGKAALAAEAGLKDAIIASMKGTTNPARLEQIAKLEREFRTFTKIFADILKVKEESARITQNQLTRTGNSLRYKLDDLPSNAEDAELPADHARRQEGDRAVSGGDGARQYVRGQFRQDGRDQRAGAPEIRRELAEGDFVDQRKDPGRDQGSLRHAGGIPAVARQADRQCQGDRGTDAGNDGVGRRDQQGLGGDEVGPAGRSEAARSRVGRRPSPRPNG